MNNIKYSTCDYLNLNKYRKKEKRITTLTPTTKSSPHVPCHLLEVGCILSTILSCSVVHSVLVSLLFCLDTQLWMENDELAPFLKNCLQAADLGSRLRWYYQVLLPQIRAEQCYLDEKWSDSFSFDHSRLRKRYDISFGPWRNISYYFSQKLTFSLWSLQ